MHEFAIAQDITSSLRESLGSDFQRLKKINIEVGCFSGIVADSLSFGLETLIGESIENDKLLIEINEKGADAVCECGNRYEVRNMFDTCPECNSIIRELSRCDNITVESVEIAEVV